jgi:formylglycine-generating enzyme required for sulfatase activity
LLEERGGLYRFLHLSFQEFLAGRYFVEAVRDIEKIAAQIENGLAVDPWWREPILLTIGYLDLTAPGEAGRLLSRLAGADDACAQRDGKMDLDQCLSAAELAASAFLECKNQPADLGERLKARLLALHARGKTEKWTPLLMANAADALDRLGYRPADLAAFVAFPGKKDIAPFLLAKYPVTNAQYARFLEAENFDKPDLWQGFYGFDADGQRITEGEEIDGWRWLNEQKTEFENGVLLPRYWRDARFGISRLNAPVVGVSWYEANAYCQWLLNNWDDLEEGKQGLPKPQLIRLPRESEWVYAAGGEQGGRFAFGTLDKAEDLPLPANTKESGIKRTTPVWMYPSGIAESGIMDLSGNVWEWQANSCIKDQFYPNGRGGSWSWGSDLGDARVSGMDDYYPDYRFNGFGFRPVALPK